MSLRFPKDIADLMQIEQNNNLNYRIVGKELVISEPLSKNEYAYNL
jgi:hypothetical protein